MFEPRFPIQDPRLDPRMRDAIAEMRETILRHYPDATFHVDLGWESPEEVWLSVTVDVEDTDDVFDLVVERLVDLQVDEGLRLQVLPLRTPERIAKMSAEGKFGPRSAAALSSTLSA